MIYYFTLLIFSIWFLKVVKDVLFWLYLWQLKNYHIGRFLAHFKTEAGEKIMRNWFVLLFFALISRFYFNQYLIIIYLIYCFYGAVSLILNKFRKPEFTKKILFLSFLCFSFLIFIIFELRVLATFDNLFLILIVLTELLIPLYVSFIILLFQPITVFLRNRIIKKARAKREKLENLLTIGITGSFGKSSVKDFLKVILSESFKVVSTEDNKNSEMGISETILKDLNNDHEIFLCEMGAYNRGGIKLLCSIAKPKIGVITGINSQHLSTFGSQENIIKAKFELIDFLPSEGLAVLNWDSKLIRKGFKRDIANIKYSILEKEDIWAEDIKVDKDKVYFKAIFNTGKSIKIEANVVGKQNIINLLCAISIARKLGMDLKEIAQAVKKITNNNFYRTKDKDVINFTYSSNPDSVLAHLDHLKLWKGKKIIVMPCLIELGKESKNVHKIIGEKIDEVCNLAIITNKECFKSLKSKKAVFINSPQEVYERVRANISMDGVVLLEGRLNEKIINLLNKK
jgi:UDP-N-acetylmuramoyl-tripeptide--D-alanyl-D-alanine ligase